MTMINTARLLRVHAPVSMPALRPEVVTHRSRPGFIECQDGSWIVLPVQHNSKQRINRRRRLWDWIKQVLGSEATAGGAA